jgi:hypothetical protein
MSIAANEQSVHITIASTPTTFPEANGGIDLTGDLEMVKASVLYADKATLCSPACSALLDGTNLVSLSTSERISFIETMPLWFPNESQLVNQAREFSDSIKNESWDKDFPFSAEQVFRRDVAPAILTLEEEVKSNTFLSKFMAKLSERSFQVGTAVTGSAAVSALIASISNVPLPEVATLAVLPLVTLAGVAGSAHVDWKKDNQNIQQNKLFFYYRTRTLLKDRTYEYVGTSE